MTAWVSDPTHGLPPLDGLGLLQCRDLDIVAPPPQDLLQLENELQLPQLPSKQKKNSKHVL